MFRKRLLRFFGIFLLIITLVFAWEVSQFKYIPVLMYHSVLPSALKENRLVVSVNTFSRQMEFLKKHNYNVIPLEKIPDFILNKKEIPPKTIAISFDDGYKDNYLYAFPVLKKYNLFATIFLVVNDIDKPDRLNWQEIFEMKNSGLISFGSHTISHPNLVSLNDEEKKKEIFESKRILEEKLASPIRTFSYPAGFFDQKIKELVKQAGYILAVSASKTRKANPSDVFTYKRVRISEKNDNNLFVFWFKTTKLYSFIKRKR
jgi:peptidoglycan/xylan/chitin deacetylase (PgdA/CDA1 family)